MASAASVLLAAYSPVVHAKGTQASAEWWAKGAAVTKLKPIEVRGSGIADATSEGLNSYAPKAITVGSKIPQTVRETPFSVTVINRQRLDDLNVTNVTDVMKRTTGMSVTRFDGAGNANNISARGFSIGSIQLDGLPVSQNTSFTTGLDAFLYDRVEVLRGPAGLLQGAGEPGGTINLTRKRALPGFSGNAGFRLGGWDTRRAELDINGSLVESDRIRARVAGVLDRRNSYVDIVRNNKTVGYGTIEFDLTPATTISFGAARQDLDTVRDLGLPTWADGTLLDLPRSTFAGRAGNAQRQKSSEMFTELEHHLGNGGLLKLAAREVRRYSTDYGVRSNTAVNPRTGEVRLEGAASRRKSSNQNVDIFLATPFEMAGRTQRALVGLSRGTEETGQAFVRSKAGGRLNIFEPDYDVALPAMHAGRYTRGSRLTRTGLYGQLQLKPMDRWTFVLGGRMDWWQTSTRNAKTGAMTPMPDASPKFTPMVGAIFELDAHSSLYASYAQTFVPQSNLDINGSLLRPRTGSQVEMGIKGEFFDKRLSTHLAVFRILDKNRAIPDPDDISGNASIAGGKVRAQGWEAEINGQVSPGLDVTAGYAYTNTKYLKAAAGQAGQVFSAATPKHSANLWVRKSWREGPLNGWNVAAGARAVSNFHATSRGIRIHGSGYAVVDARLGYQFSKTTSASLMVTNLFDRKYYEKVSGTARQNFYGEPRNVMLSLKAAW